MSAHPVTTIIEAAAKHFNKEPALIRCARRHAPVVRARHIGIFLSREMTKATLSEIGEQFGDRDHSTIWHAYDKIAGRLPVDRKLAADVEAVRALAIKADPRLGGGHG